MMMTENPSHLDDIAKQLSNLSNELKGCTDSEKRRALLREFRALLGEADKIAEESAK